MTDGILAVSTASIFIRYAQQEAPSLVIAAYRLGLATLLLIPAIGRGARDEIRGLQRNQVGRLLLSGVFLALHFSAWITSLEYTSVTSSVVLVTTTPLWVAVFSPLVLKEKIRREVWIGLILAMIGGIIVGLQSACDFQEGKITCENFGNMLAGKALTGNFLALTGAWMAAGYMLMGRSVRGNLSLTSYTFLVYGVSAIILLAFVIIMGLPVTGYSGNIYLWFLLLAVIPQLLGHSSFNWALKYLPAAVVATALLGEPIGTTILAVIFLAEIPHAGEIIGGILILIGIYITSRASIPTQTK